MLITCRNRWLAGNPYFAHDGVNAGFENFLIAYEQGGNGAVVMTNAMGGLELAHALVGSIAKVYDWPDLQPIVRTAIKLDPSILATCAGVYDVRQRPKILFGHQAGERAAGGPEPLPPEIPTLSGNSERVLRPLGGSRT